LGVFGKTDFAKKRKWTTWTTWTWPRFSGPALKSESVKRLLPVTRSETRHDNKKEKCDQKQQTKVMPKKFKLSKSRWRPIKKFADRFRPYQVKTLQTFTAFTERTLELVEETCYFDKDIDYHPAGLVHHYDDGEQCHSVDCDRFNEMYHLLYMHKKDKWAMLPPAIKMNIEKFNLTTCIRDVGRLANVNGFTHFKEEVRDIGNGDVNYYATRRLEGFQEYKDIKYPNPFYNVMPDIIERGWAVRKKFIESRCHNIDDDVFVLNKL
jgi:hypothetical protein